MRRLASFAESAWISTRFEPHVWNSALVSAAMVSRAKPLPDREERVSSPSRLCMEARAAQYSVLVRAKVVQAGLDRIA